MRQSPDDDERTSVPRTDRIRTLDRSVVPRSLSTPRLSRTPSVSLSSSLFPHPTARVLVVRRAFPGGCLIPRPVGRVPGSLVDRGPPPARFQTIPPTPTTSSSTRRPAPNRPRPVNHASASKRSTSSSSSSRSGGRSPAGPPCRTRRRGVRARARDRPGEHARWLDWHPRWRWRWRWRSRSRWRWRSRRCSRWPRPRVSRR